MPDDGESVRSQRQALEDTATCTTQFCEYTPPTANAGDDHPRPRRRALVTENSASKIGRITTTGSITEYPIPPPNTQPQGLAIGPDGSLWFTERSGGKIGVMPRPPYPP